MSVMQSIKQIFGRMFGQTDPNLSETEQAKAVVHQLRNQLRREERIRLGKHRRTRR